MLDAAYADLRNKVRAGLEHILGAVDVPEPLQRVGAQCETEARAIRRMYRAVRMPLPSSVIACAQVWPGSGARQYQARRQSHRDRIDKRCAVLLS